MRLAGKVFIIKGFFADKEGTGKPGGGRALLFTHYFKYTGYDAANMPPIFALE
jgi:hypothetical protein